MCWTQQHVNNTVFEPEKFVLKIFSMMVHDEG